MAFRNRLLEFLFMDIADFMEEMSIGLGFLTRGERTLIGDLGDFKLNSSNSAETGLERARRLTICPPGEIASATSSFSFPLLTGGWKTGDFKGFILSGCLPRNRA